MWGIRYTVRDLDGRVLREFDLLDGKSSVWNWARDYIWAGSRLLAIEDASGRQHIHPDHLGSTRLVTDASGNRVSYHEFDPLGMEITPPYQDDVRMKFTGHERDSLADQNTFYDVDYMHARDYSHYFGRFLSLDPAPADPSNPQSWHPYAYVLNNPTLFVDPTGMSIDLSLLTSSELGALMQGLEDFTGNKYGVDERGMLILLSANADASETATNFLDELIASDRVYAVESRDRFFKFRGARDKLETAECSNIILDFSDQAFSKKVDMRTFNIGSSLVHELAHTAMGLEDPPDSTPTALGPVVNFVNTIRRERGFPERARYFARNITRKSDIQNRIVRSKLKFRMPGGRIRNVTLVNFR